MKKIKSRILSIALIGVISVAFSGCSEIENPFSSYENREEGTIDAIISLAEGTMGKLYDVNYDYSSDSLVFRPNDEWLIAAIIAVENGEREMTEMWEEEYVPSIKVLSRTVEALDEYSTVKIIHPYENKVILECDNGKVLTDFSK